MLKLAAADHPVHDLVRERWSPYAFADRDVSRDDLLSLFEAARWAPSSYNEQPWSFLIATRSEPDPFQQVLSCLVEANQTWAQHAPVLVLTFVRPTFTRNQKPNAAAEHDLGLCVGNLCLEATARGLAVHQMIGIVPAKVRAVFQVPEDIQPLTAIAIGYAGDPETLPEALRERDTTPRQRRPLSEFLFAGKWGTSAGWTG